MKFIKLLFILLPFWQCTAQTNTYGRCINPEFEKKVNSYLNYSVPVITIDDLIKIKDEVIILDAREMNEYKVSHIPGAKYVGYKDNDFSVLDDLSPDQRIVVYCSIGYRSEKIAEKIKDKGFSEVYNLYGSIFEWVNQDHPVVDVTDTKTRKVHTYNKGWSKWIMEGKAEKVW